MDDLSLRLAALTTEQHRLLAERMREAGRLPEISPRPGHGPAPLSHGQERIWLAEQSDPGSGALHLACKITVHGALDTASLARALHDLASRQEILRTRFFLSGAEPVQQAEISPSVVLRRAEWSPSGERGHGSLDSLVERETRRPFDLVRAETFRVVAVTLSPQCHVLVIVMHHIVVDEWSTGVLLAELGALYNATVRGVTCELEPLPFQYADYAVWERACFARQHLAASRRYWLRALTGLPPEPDPPGGPLGRASPHS